MYFIIFIIEEALYMDLKFKILNNHNQLNLQLINMNQKYLIII